MSRRRPDYLDRLPLDGAVRTQAEVARALGIDKTTACKLEQRALAKLRRAFRRIGVHRTTDAANDRGDLR